ncbi:FlgO family outer membrane protein [Desulfovibrio sp. X2]|uniref:FlgO family outer membrane protein n=1 Tax=Desulfovibrio sp. X2 TaxID=941449 RepID=UPI0012691273|nr:FlgO family outer membrane protein [Desulfovibrio sp. X2]
MFTRPSAVSGIVAAAVLLAALLSFGCSSQSIDDAVKSWNRMYPEKTAAEKEGVLLTSNYEAANRLASGLSDRDVDENARIVLTSFVDVDDLDNTSTLGRVIPEQISSRLAQKGFTTVELKGLTPQIEVREGQGEFGLSRRVKPVNKTTYGYAVLVGTYAVGLNVVTVNARIVRSSDNAVLAGADYNIPLTPNVMRMADLDTSRMADAPIVPSVSTVLPSERPASAAQPTLQPSSLATPYSSAPRTH